MAARPAPNSGLLPRAFGGNEHLLEIGEILAAGLMRLMAAKSSRMSADGTDKPVDCEGVWSGAVAARDEENRE